MKSDKHSSYPPKARLVLRIGVTGHRLNNLPLDQIALNEGVRMVLQEIQNALMVLSSEPEIKAIYRDDTPKIRIISPLAEGADRIVAEQGFALGFELQCPLPFLRDQYADDFQSVNSRQAYYELLDRANAVFELDGDCATVANRQRAYEAVGRLVIRHSDLLIAIWNGKPAEGRGGTSEIVEQALHQGHPVIQIEPNKPSHPYCLTLDDDRKIKRNSTSDLTNLIRSIVGLKDKNQLQSGTLGNYQYEAQEENSRLDYFEESWPKNKCWLACYHYFFNFLSCPYPTVRIPRLKSSQKQAEESICKDAIRQDYSVDLTDDEIERQINPYYEWADNLAIYYAKHYRSAFVLAYLLSALAVFLPLMSHLLEMRHYKTDIYGVNILIFSELLVVSFICLLIDNGGKKNWHRRWVEYRLLAETFRLTTFLLLLGGMFPRLKATVCDSRDNLVNSWVYWYAIALAREVGLPSVSCDVKFRNDHRKKLINMISNQVSYHKKLSDRAKKMIHRTHIFGKCFFWIIVLSCLVHLLDPYFEINNIEGYTLLIAAFFPAFGAALAGILSQGEFYRIERRSKAMSDQLQSIVNELQKGESNSMAKLANLAESAAETMIAEVMDWRVMFLAKSLEDVP